MNLNIRILEYDTTMTRLKVSVEIEGQDKPKDFLVIDQLTNKIFDEIYTEKFHLMTTTVSDGYSWIIGIS